MADDTTLVPVSAPRDRLRTRRRRARLGTILGLVIVLAASASAYAFTHHQDANATQDTGRTPSNRNQPAADTETTRRVATKAVIASDPPRVLTHAQPLQLWVGGDSL